MFRLINCHLQAYSLQVKSQDAVHTLGSQCVYISGMFKSYHLPMKVKLAKYVLCKFYLYNKNSCADVQISIAIRIQALRDVFIQIKESKMKNLPTMRNTSLDCKLIAPSYKICHGMRSLISCGKFKSYQMLCLTDW
jgi:hypothetical protein